MNNKELLPCPFCGGEAELVCVDGEFYMACCKKCHSSTSFAKVFEDGTAAEATKIETITAWNTRYNSMIVKQNGNNCTNIANAGTVTINMGDKK